MEEITSRVSYDFDAAGDPYSPYSNPWQLIAVFDDDPDTNVVCTGYSKAFQYLCDLSQFLSPKLACYIVTGSLGGEGSSEGIGHMWNIVTMDDGKNYLVDITNCQDWEGNGRVDGFFLRGTKTGTPDDMYEFPIEYSIAIEYLVYQYNDMCRMMYGTDILTLADYNYRTKKVMDPVVSIASDTYEYTGAPITPKVTVTDGRVMIPEEEYLITYSQKPMWALPPSRWRTVRREIMN